MLAKTLALFGLIFVGAFAQNNLVFSDDFNDFDLSVWEHELTMGGGGNWEFEMYVNNRSNSYVRDSILYINPTYTANVIGLQNLMGGFNYDNWGSQPADVCTGNEFYGCFRTSGAGGNILNPIQSARIRTAQSFNFQYGRMEVRAKLPLGDWLWPAIWLLPRYQSYGTWPASGEIDVVESRGNAAGYAAGGVDTFASTLHWGPHWPEDAWSLTHEAYTLSSGDFSQNFHVFGLVWTNQSIITYVDEESNVVLKVPINESFWSKGGWESTYNNPWVGRPDNAPFDQQFYVIFNLAVGGTNGYFPDGMGGKPWSDESQNAANEFWSGQGQWMPTWNGENAALQIDYIKIWQ